MIFAHEPGCDERHTRRQQCNGPVAEEKRRAVLGEMQPPSQEAIVVVDRPLRGPSWRVPQLPMHSLARAVVLEFSPAIVGVYVIAFVSAWEPVQPGILPNKSETWILLALIPIFFVAGLGWLSLGTILGSGLVFFVRGLVALIMIGAVGGAHLYSNCDPQLLDGCVAEPSEAEMGVYRVSAMLNIAIPAASTTLILLWGAVSSIQSGKTPEPTGQSL